MPNKIRIVELSLAVLLLLPWQAAAVDQTARFRFELSFSASARTEPVDGRVFVIVTRKADPEPRLQFGKSGGQYASTPFFGEDVEGLRPGSRAVVDAHSIGYPFASLADIPPGDYYVQALLNIYTTFR